MRNGIGSLQTVQSSVDHSIFDLGGLIGLKLYVQLNAGGFGQFIKHRMQAVRSHRQNQRQLGDGIELDGRLRIQGGIST